MKINFLILATLALLCASTTLAFQPTQAPNDRIEDFNQKYLWGTYKPQLIHCITQRNTVTNNPTSIGLMYYQNQASLKTIADLQYILVERIGDETIFNYEYHDGYQYSQHTTQDPYLNINFENSFFKLAHQTAHQEWIDIMRPFTPFVPSSSAEKNKQKTQSFIEEQKGDDEKFTVLYYVSIEQANPDLQDYRTVTFSEQSFGQVVNIQNGDNTEYVTFYGSGARNFVSYTIFDSDRQLNYNMKEQVYDWIKDGSQTSSVEKGTYIVLQFELDQSEAADYELIVHYDSTQPNFSPVQFTTLEQQYQTLFNQAYENVYGTPSDDLQEAQWECGRASFSNLMGGIQYSYGDLLCQNKELENCKVNLPMFTHTPSRYEFPRPYLWDEGFHLQVSCQFDREFCMNDIENWFGTQSSIGWIPREQPRGPELRDYIPDYPLNENDPNPQTIMWSLNYIYNIAKTQSDQYMIDRVQALLPKIDLWYDWWVQTQKIEGYNLYKWWGPVVTENWGSGMDDFPRSDGDYYSIANIDASAWMVNFCQNIYSLQKDVDSKKASFYLKEAQKIMADIDKYMKDDETNQYRDLLYNPNTEDYKLAPYNGYPDYIPIGLYLLNKNDSNLVNDQVGYLTDKETLWTNYGIRSLSEKSDMFGVGSNYWRGNIWINMQYLFANALSQFYQNNENAMNAYQQLRRNVGNNVCRVRNERGYFFETFNEPPDETGDGNNSHPFNGWTSTVTLLITERFMKLVN